MVKSIAVKTYLRYLAVKEKFMELKKEEGISEFVAAIGLVAIAAAVALLVSPTAKNIVNNLLNKAGTKINGLF